jgi:Domain of unknown function (DUF4349)
MQTKRFCFAVLAAGIVVAAAACSSASSTNGANRPYQDGNGYSGAQATLAPAYNGNGAGAAPTAAASAGSQSKSGGAQASGAQSTGAAGAPVAESQIVKIGTVSVQVTAIDESVVRATDQIHLLGGWLAGSDRSVSSATDMASVTYRIPVARFEDALAAMRKLGVKVLSEHTESTPVGGQMADLQARIDNLRTSEKAIQTLMAQAKTIDEILTVQQRLTDIRGQIEQLSGQLAGLADTATFSTLTVVLMVPIVATPSPTASPSPSPSPSATATIIPWSAGDQAGQAAGTLGEVGKSTATILIWLVIVVLPITAGFIFLLALFWFLGRVADPYRRRLLPFTVAKPVSWPAVPAYGPYAGMAPAPAPRPEQTQPPKA